MANSKSLNFQAILMISIQTNQSRVKEVLKTAGNLELHGINEIIHNCVSEDQQSRKNKL